MAKTIHFVEGREESIPYTLHNMINYYTLCDINWEDIKNEHVMDYYSESLVTCRKCRKEMKKRGWFEQK